MSLMIPGKAEIDAATRVLENTRSQGLDLRAIVKTMLDVAYATRCVNLTIPAKMKKKGEPILIEYADKGDLIPGHDSKGNYYEVLTSWFRFKHPNGKFYEHYVQVARNEIERREDGAQFRRAEEMKALAKAGVDLASVEWSKP
jgi:hypothetical protein